MLDNAVLNELFTGFIILTGVCAVWGGVRYFKVTNLMGSLEAMTSKELMTMYHQTRDKELRERISQVAESRYVILLSSNQTENNK